MSSDVISGKQGKIKRSRLTLSDANKDQSVGKLCLRAKIAFKIKRYATGFNISSRALLPCINFLRGKMNLIPWVSWEKSERNHACDILRSPRTSWFLTLTRRLPGLYTHRYTGRTYIVTRGILWARNTRTLSLTVGNRKPSKNAWAVTKHAFNYTLRRIGATGDTQLRFTRNIFLFYRLKDEVSIWSTCRCIIIYLKYI